MNKDIITLQRMLTIHPKLRNELALIYDEICKALEGRAMCRFSQVLRTIDEQDALYAQGRTKPGKIVTNAKGGQSYHCYGLAVDIVLIIDGKTASWDMNTDFDGDKKADWMEVVAIFKKYGWEWGGEFKSFRDNPHFQRTFGKSIAQLKSFPKDKDGYPIF
jgi:peptidoglycan L-alanyl-D-glutamate endopeptidase CwlK